MMLQSIAIVIFIFTALRLLVILTNIFTKQWLSVGYDNGNEKVSVLIPCRNEENNISVLLNNLTRQEYKNLEILVYDDESTDHTASIIHSFALQYPQIRYIKGNPLPEGWSGKIYACHKLAQEATGEYLLFTDADVLFHAGCITSAVSHLKKHNLHLLSLFPQQQMLTRGEKITVPVMNWILVSFLPLILTRLSKRPSLSAANGQFMLFRGESYRKHQFHQAIKRSLVEDIHIFRYMKKLGLQVHTLLGNGFVECRMYHSYSEAIDGFSKNITDFFSGRGFMILFSLATLTGLWLIFFSLPRVLFFVYLGMIIAIQTGFSFASGQNIFDNLRFLLHQRVAFFHMVYKALKIKRKGTYIWKGRAISCD
ncbi:MAG: glycosyltransferase family 2 protein [Sphingobacteriia bacterium]|nr:glycosyltransferase family 2 protein [Bacteroidales bacterium]MDY0286903.1 glycosyltransferase family 2 protein [Bacteroidales bacterium]NCC74347.1 glycosyltransferase family 2 protein [Sphingobacteriia bacterium]